MDHQRIDEGLKRGPKKPKPRNHSRVAKDPTRNPIPPDLDAKLVLEMYLESETTSQLAAQLGVRRSSLTLWLREHHPEDWKNVQIAKALMRKEDADDGLESADNALDLARAREMLRSGQWDLERLDSKNYGPKQEVAVTIDHQVAVEHSLSTDASELLGRIRQGNAAPLSPVIDVTPDPVPVQPID
jgi:hypothetical protein